MAGVGWVKATVLAVCFAVASATAAPVRLAQPPAVPASDQRLEQAAKAIDAGQYDSAIKSVEAFLASPTNSQRDGDWAAYLKARALAAKGRAADAEAVVRERQREYPNGYNWASLVSILVNCGKAEDAAKAIVALEDGDFILANRLRLSVIESILSDLEKKNAEIKDTLISRLVEDRYTGPASQHVPDTLRLRYINLQLRQNRVEGAVRETLSIESPTVLSILLTDKSFAPIWVYPGIQALMAPGALAARTERGIQARLEQPIVTSADWLELMRSLRVIGKGDEAVRLGLRAIEQARRSKSPVPVALRLEIAQAYADTGELWAARRTARELQKEQAVLPVSLRVAIAHVLEITGDDDGAILMLSTMEGVESVPEAQRVMACAAHDLGRIEKRDEALANLELASPQASTDLFDAYVCSGFQEKAKQALIGMFSAAETRTAAILTAQLYSDTAKAGTDLSELRYRMRSLIASADVQEAIKPYARTLGLPFTIANAR